MTHSSPSRTALVRIEAGSEPASGSERANAGEISPVAQARQEALLLLVGAEQRDRQRPQLLDHQDQRARGAGHRDLLDRDLEHQRPGAGAAVLGGERKAEDVLLAEQLADVPGVLAGGVDLGGSRGGSSRLAEVPHLLRQLVRLRRARELPRQVSSCSGRGLPTPAQAAPLPRLSALLSVAVALAAREHAGKSVRPGTAAGSLLSLAPSAHMCHREPDLLPELEIIVSAVWPQGKVAAPTVGLSGSTSRTAPRSAVSDTPA